eukprot:TRINITY_DN27354_c0_g1_i1.p1 TRINITY_DN27354_c0_g1~~TRINITY_DN27354_c0_g1_i1.p1  ORF type:complete len:247 (+),score=40.34 TRINITY_DN27354_c0_g1_i1:84-824(+)
MEKREEKVYLEKRDNVYYMRLNNAKANNFNTEFIRAIHVQLDEVEKEEGICSLVFTSTMERFFSTGLDLKFLTSLKHSQDTNNFLLEYQGLLGRILVFHVPTIAMMNGIAMAGGLLFSMACDYRIMINDPKAFVCLNEVDMGMPLLPGMNTVAQCKLSPIAFRELFLTGRRISPKEALSLQIVDQVHDKADLADAVHKLANSLAEKTIHKNNVRALKTQAYYDAHERSTNNQFGIHSQATARLARL